MKWRTGCEGRISTLKRGYGWDRTRLDGTEGARIWTGQGILAHNLVKIGPDRLIRLRNEDRHNPARIIRDHDGRIKDYFRSK